MAEAGQNPTAPGAAERASPASSPGAGEARFSAAGGAQPPEEETKQFGPSFAEQNQEGWRQLQENSADDGAGAAGARPDADGPPGDDSDDPQSLKRQLDSGTAQKIAEAETAQAAEEEAAEEEEEDEQRAEEEANQQQVAQEEARQQQTQARMQAAKQAASGNVVGAAMTAIKGGLLKSAVKMAILGAIVWAIGCLCCLLVPVVSVILMIAAIIAQLS